MFGEALKVCLIRELPNVKLIAVTSDHTLVQRPSIGESAQNSSASSSRHVNTAETNNIASPTQLPLHESASSGDDAGPRFGEDTGEKDSRALPGTAGHPGVYRGPNVSILPFTGYSLRCVIAIRPQYDPRKGRTRRNLPTS